MQPKRLFTSAQRGQRIGRSQRPGLQRSNPIPNGMAKQLSKAKKEGLSICLLRETLGTFSYFFVSTIAALKVPFVAPMSCSMEQRPQQNLPVQFSQVCPSSLDAENAACSRKLGHWPRTQQLLADRASASAVSPPCCECHVPRRWNVTPRTSRLNPPTRALPCCRPIQIPEPTDVIIRD